MTVSEVLHKHPYPSARSGHRLVAVGNCLILFGGYTQRHLSDHPPIGELKEEVWCYHILTEKWKLLVTNKENFPSSTASCAVLSVGSKVIVFGGSGAQFGQTNSSKLQMLDMETLQWKSMKLSGDEIEGGYGHSISFTDDGYLYLYGGCDGQFYFNSMHKICMKTWNNKSYFRHNFQGRYRHESIEDKGRIYIIGGGSPFARETFDTLPYFCTKTNTWNMLKVNSRDNPPGRMAHSCNKMKNHIVVTGGQIQKTLQLMHGDIPVGIPYNDALCDVWLFNLQTYYWFKLPISLPQDIFFHSGAVGSDGRLYTFGGSKYVAWNNSEGNPQRIHKRINNLYKIDIFVPSLLELSWSVFYEQFNYLDFNHMLELGIPRYLAERGVY